MINYYVYKTDDSTWLDDSEHRWTGYFNEAACFTSAELARDIANRENTLNENIVVLASV